MPQNSKATRVLARGLPDHTIHQAPGAIGTLGVIGIVAGIGANGWQMYTTICSVYQMFTGSYTPDFNLKNPVFDACLLIAFASQYALLMLVFKIDTAWKRQQTGAGAKKRGVGGVGAATVEVVQQLGLMAIWIGLAFLIDTLGDMTFIGNHTGSADAGTSAFLIFLYAVSLYALSTIAFARAIEYLWSASAVKDRIQAMKSRRSLYNPGPDSPKQERG
jgi:hypothetical protein